MGILLEININDSRFYEQLSEKYKNGGIPQEYPFPCPILTPENLGYSRPNPYPFERY